MEGRSWRQLKEEIVAALCGVLIYYTWQARNWKLFRHINVDDVPLESVAAVIGDYEICVVKNFRMNSDVLSHAKSMKLIMQFGVGLEGVDINAATKHGIKVARIPGGATGNAASCAEMAIYLILGLLRKQHQLKISVEQKKLGEPIGDNLQGKTVFILGFGNIGIHLAKRLRPFDVKILATKRSWGRLAQDSSKSEAPPVENDCYADLVDERGSHADILKFASKADIVVCCLAMNSETAGIVNNDFISVMRKDRKTGQTIVIGYESQGLYHLTSSNSFIACSTIDPPDLIHKRLEHPSLSKLQKMVPSLSSLSTLDCESCQLGKHTRATFSRSIESLRVYFLISSL
ncbi:formate dehydrogenase isoform X3 [Capsicum annuum]|uniref:formate dehydrogenase isoform X3 n=1 Tax=Capsicum annuum TaxID=4072 RepID=UPI001FB11CDF|nr:formate dehydrogenase isoform X3 [Capsicum annuum]XP_047267988.1 formate dehydrogenase isoform X3 [Capsicum annuum]